MLSGEDSNPTELVNMISRKDSNIAEIVNTISGEGEKVAGLLMLWEGTKVLLEKRAQDSKGEYAVFWKITNDINPCCKVLVMVLVL